jgi:hypothetical protein
MTTIESTPTGEPILVRPTRIAPGSALGLILWAVLLVAGFAIVLGLGTPLADDRSQLEQAYKPTPPVSEAQAIAAADTIVRFDYPQFANGARSVTHEDTFGDDRYTIVYKIPRQATGVRISISVKGSVTVSTYP